MNNYLFILPWLSYKTLSGIGQKSKGQGRLIPFSRTISAQTEKIIKFLLFVLTFLNIVDSLLKHML
ncbi:hypothetical protein BpHYR1_006872 [Brachionus plicatilis]|uniref:Uncharacterized protein n=1 Tax=Brachionus plicatilis TaxID=10195 RepID=A0A3M7PW08_BRAPC|nr:hypothetical protein BpHYR1_006872 [Brachionus plicatilis]